MSQVTRYTTKLLQSDKTGRLEICPCYEGEWIAYSDYAALAAEYKRLKGLYELAMFEWARGCPPPLMPGELKAAKEGRDAK